MSDGKKIPQQSFTIVDAIFWFVSSIHTKFMPTKIPPLRTDHSLAGNLEVAFERSVWTQRCHQQLEGQSRKSKDFSFFKHHTTITLSCQRQYNAYLFMSKTTFTFLSQAVAKKASVLRRRRSKGSIFSINVSE